MSRLVQITWNAMCAVALIYNYIACFCILINLRFCIICRDYKVFNGKHTGLTAFDSKVNYLSSQAKEAE